MKPSLRTEVGFGVSGGRWVRPHQLGHLPGDVRSADRDVHLRHLAGEPAAGTVRPPQHPCTPDTTVARWRPPSGSAARRRRSSASPAPARPRFPNRRPRRSTWLCRSARRSTPRWATSRSAASPTGSRTTPSTSICRRSASTWRPTGVTDPTDPQAQLFGTTQPIPAGTNPTMMVQLVSNAAAVFQTFTAHLSTPFNFIAADDGGDRRRDPGPDGTGHARS